MRRIYVGDFKIGEEERRAVNEVLDIRRISEGAKVREFEKTFAKYIGTRYAVAVSSGTAALMAGMTALIHHEGIINVKHSTKAITTPITYIAPSNYVCHTLSEKTGLPFVTIANFVPHPPEDIPPFRFSDYFLYVGVLESRKGIMELVKLFNDHRPDNAPLVALEALSVGTPVVASNMGGLPEIAGLQGEGFVCDLDHLKDALIRVRNASPEHQQMRDIYQRHFSPEVFLSRYLELVMERRFEGSGE